MVRGIESFRDWFHDYKDQYVIIGGTACDLLMREEGLELYRILDEFEKESDPQLKKYTFSMYIERRGTIIMK